MKLDSLKPAAGDSYPIERRVNTLDIAVSLVDAAVQNTEKPPVSSVALGQTVEHTSPGGSESFENDAMAGMATDARSQIRQLSLSAQEVAKNAELN